MTFSVKQILNVKRTVQRRNGLTSLFPISLYTLKTDWSARAEWTSSDVPSRELVLTTLWDEIRDVYLST
jgi:hypothetical protein